MLYNNSLLGQCIQALQGKITNLGITKGRRVKGSIPLAINGSTKYMCEVIRRLERHYIHPRPRTPPPPIIRSLFCCDRPVHELFIVKSASQKRSVYVY